jgi:hypothetical protein
MLLERYAVVTVRFGLDQDENHAANLRGTRVAPQMICTPLDDDVTWTEKSSDTVFEFQLQLSGQHDAVVDAVGTVHRRAVAREHVDDANHRALGQRQTGVPPPAIRFVVVVSGDGRRRPKQGELGTPTRDWRCVEPFVRPDYRAPLGVVARNHSTDWSRMPAIQADFTAYRYRIGE